MTLVEQMWKRLDSVMDELALLPKSEWPSAGFMQYDDPQEKLEEYIGNCEFEANLKGRARGIAEMIAIFMQPHFTDANEVAREAKRRAEARAREDSQYETKGLGSLRYSPPGEAEAQKYKREPAKPKKKPSVTEEDAAKIRKAYGHFPVEMLAKTFSITVAQVEEIAKSEPATT